MKGVLLVSQGRSEREGGAASGEDERASKGRPKITVELDANVSPSMDQGEAIVRR